MVPRVLSRRFSRPPGVMRPPVSKACLCRDPARPHAPGCVAGGVAGVRPAVGPRGPRRAGAGGAGPSPPLPLARTAAGRPQTLPHPGPSWLGEGPASPTTERRPTPQGGDPGLTAAGGGGSAPAQPGGVRFCPDPGGRRPPRPASRRRPHPHPLNSGGVPGSPSPPGPRARPGTPTVPPPPPHHHHHHVHSGAERPHREPLRRGGS